MQIEIDTEILETIFTHATTAARHAGYIDNVDNVVDIDDIDDAIDALIKSINEICRVVAGLLGKSYAPQPAGAPIEDGEPEFNVANAVDDLRQLVAKADALANAAESLLDEMIWVNDDADDDRRRRDRLAHLVGTTSEAVLEAMEVGDRLAVELSTRQPGK